MRSHLDLESLDGSMLEPAHQIKPMYPLVCHYSKHWLQSALGDVTAKADADDPYGDIASGTTMMGYTVLVDSSGNEIYGHPTNLTDKWDCFTRNKLAGDVVESYDLSAPFSSCKRAIEAVLGSCGATSRYWASDYPIVRTINEVGATVVKPYPFRLICSQ